MYPVVFRFGELSYLLATKMHARLSYVTRMMSKVSSSSLSRSMPSPSPSPTASAALLQTVQLKLEDVLAVPEASAIIAEKKTQELCKYYSTLIPEDKTVFLKTLATSYSVNQSTVLQLASSLAAVQDRGPTVLLRAEDRLRHALIPRYQHLFTQISRLEHGVKFLVDLRTDILKLVTSHSCNEDNPYLLSMNVCLRDLVSLWFSVGFLHLYRITWSSPCDMLQKISDYEAVHPIRSVTDLKRRVGSYRRCFIFTHNSMPDEPVVVLHTALTNEISSNIQSIVSRNGQSPSDNGGPEEAPEDPNLITTAIFYSITSTQKGLQGVELGNYLIKSVVRELLSEFPRMSHFSSLSPIPGFRDWLLSEINKYTHQFDCGEFPEQHILLEAEVSPLEGTLGVTGRNMWDVLRKSLSTNSWASQPRLVNALKEPLMRNCARYLYVEKRRSFALNPVANFHLRNGAVMWRLNWAADMSPRGLGAACGLMLNYRYYLDRTEQISKAYMDNQEIECSEQISELVSKLATLPNHSSPESNSS